MSHIDDGQDYGMDDAVVYSTELTISINESDKRRKYIEDAMRWQMYEQALMSQVREGDSR